MNSFLKFLKIIIKNKYKYFSSIISKRLGNIVLHVENNINANNSEIAYVNLAPKDDIDKKGIYNHALDWALKDNDVFNIALTGSYGSGKSSILKTYVKQHPENNYLNISLATFQGEGEINENENIEIERSILQQLFYKVRAEKIPYSRFRKIKNFKLRNITKWILIVLTSVVSGILLFFPSVLTQIDENVSILREQKFSDFTIIILIIMFVTTFFLIGTNILKNFIRSIKLSNIKLSNTEFGLSEEDESSILNKYLDEILYFFEVTKYNVVIIEDLDRFENIEVFTNLRELNTLINNSDQVNRRVIFIYAIKDEMFLNKERTKFFDFIIPVIPVINSSNSNELLIEKIKKAGFENLISESFINDITVYIDDMRILNNIYNEYIIYKKNLDGVGLNHEKLFSIIVYKNIYPKDFADLQFNKGMVYEAFINKNAVISTYISEITDQCSELENQLKEIEQEHLNSLKELRVIFIDFLRENDRYVYRFDVNNTTYYSKDIIEGTYDFNIFNNFRYMATYNEKGYHIKTYSKEDIDEILKNRLRFYERQEFIKLKNEDSLEQIKLELNNLRRKIQEAKSWSLMTVIEEVGIKEVLNENLQANKLLVFLLRNGYIDEMYHNYITYFYPGSLTQEDMKFVMSIKDQEGLEYAYRLTNVDKVISRLNKNEFKKIEVLNYSLVEYILENKDVYSEYFELIITQLSNESEASISFIDGYKGITSYLDIFFKYVCKAWNNIWDFIVNRSSLPVDSKDQYLKSILLYGDIEDIEAINKEYILTKYISNKSDFIKLISHQDDLQKIKNSINALEVKFKYIGEEFTNTELYNYICENNIYEINIDMINQVAHIKAGCNLQNLYRSNFTCICQSEYDSLYKYIDQNIEHYIKNVLLAIPENIYESEEILIELLNRDDVSIGTKEEVIIKQNVCFSNIADIDNELWDILMINNKIANNWDNIIHYYKYIESINSNIVQFFNKENNYIELSECKLNSSRNFDDETYKKISLDIIKCEEMSETVFIKISESIPYIYNRLDTSKISGERVKNIINCNLIKLTNDLYDNLREFHRDKLILFLEKNIDLFIKELEKYEVDKDNIHDILKSNQINFEKKAIFISYVGEEDAIDKLEFLELICETAIGSQHKISIKKFLLKNIFESNVQENLKIKLLINQIEFLDESDITEYLIEIGEPYSELSIKGKKPLVDKSRLNIKLLDELSKKDYISSYRDKNDQLRVHTKRK